MSDIPPFLYEMAERLRMQDNRCTKHAMFCVQRLERHDGIDSEYGTDYTWRDGEWDQADEEQAKKLDQADDDDDDKATKGWTKVYHRDEWGTVMVALTEKGAADHIAANGHNLTGPDGEGPRIYVESFHRCQEMIDLREWLMTLRSPPPQPDGGVSEEMVEAALNVPLDGVESPGCWRVRSILTTAQVRAALLAAGKGKQ